MDLILVAGAQLSAITLGQEAPALVMVHGLMFGNLATWYSSIAAPLSRKHRVLLYDQRGHGASPVTPTGYDLDTQALDLQGVIAHYGYDDEAVDLVGHSMGALIALHFALRYPHRVRRLVLIDPPYPVEQHVLPEMLRVLSPEALTDYIDERADLRAGRRLERMRRRLSSLLFETTLVRDLQAMRPIDDAALAQLACPVLLVVGERSFCADASYDLQRRLSRAQLVSIDCGHYIPEEAPLALYQVISEFCELPA